jgi:predicted peptidase
MKPEIKSRYKMLLPFVAAVFVFSAAYSYPCSNSHKNLLNRHKMELKLDTGKNSKPVDPLHPDYNTAPLQDWEKKFTDFQFKVYKNNGHVLPYRFHQPEKIEDDKKYPLVLFLHGAGERGLDNRGQFLRFTTVPFWEKYSCYILAPQCPPRITGSVAEGSVWVQTSFGASAHTMNAEPTWSMQLVMELLDKTMSDKHIDHKRIYVTGLSMGGFATWEILQREGDKFAAAIPVCGGADLNYAKQLINIPLWVFHGDADTTVPVKRSRDAVEAITAAGGHPKYTELPGVGHGAWAYTYTKPEVWDWLFSQEKK